MIWKKIPQNKLLLEAIQNLSRILESGRKHLLSGFLTKRSYGEEKLWWMRIIFYWKMLFKKHVLDKTININEIYNGVLISF